MQRQCGGVEKKWVNGEETGGAKREEGQWDMAHVIN